MCFCYRPSASCLGLSVLKPLSQLSFVRATITLSYRKACRPQPVCDRREGGGREGLCYKLSILYGQYGESLTVYLLIPFFCVYLNISLTSHRMSRKLKLNTLYALICFMKLLSFYKISKDFTSREDCRIHTLHQPICVIILL